MQEKERLIQESYHDQTLVRLTYETPHTRRNVFFGVVYEHIKSLHKYRMKLIDEKMLQPRMDDLGNVQTLTLELRYVRTIERIASVVWTHEGIKASPLLKPTMNDALIEPLFEQVSTYWLDELDIPRVTDRKSHQTAYFESILSIRVEERLIPVLSNAMVYDLSNNAWKNSRLYLHDEQSLDKYFKWVPSSRHHQLETMLEKYIKDGYSLDRTAYRFKQIRHVTLEAKRRLKTVLSTPMNRPLKAFFNQLKPKNMGRKDYCLPLKQSHPNLLLNQWVFSFLKHPVTVINSKESTADFIELVIQACLLNNRSLLIVDGSGKTGEQHFSAGLSFMNEQHLDASIGHWLSQDNVDKEPIELKMTDFDETHQSLLSGHEWFENMKTLMSLKKQAESLHLFHETITLESVIDTLWKTVPIMSTSSWVEHLIQDEVLANQLALIKQSLVEKLQSSHPSKLHKTLTITDSKARYKAMLLLLNHKTYFHQVIQYFRVMRVKDTSVLPMVKNAFDMVLIINPNKQSLVDLYFADRVCVISNNNLRDVQSEHIGLSHPHARGFGHIFTTFSMMDNDAIRRYPIPFGIEGVKSMVHHVESDHEPHPHVSNKEIDALEAFLSNHQDYPVIRTPFNAQKHRIKARLNTPVDTLYHPVIGSPMCVSWALHKGTSQKTYDWMKNNPPMLFTLAHAEKIAAFIDMAKFIALSDGDDPLFKHIVESYECSEDVFDCYPLAGIFKDVLGHQYKGYVSEKPALGKLFKSSSLTIKASHALYDQTMKCCYLVILINDDMRYNQLKHLVDKAQRFNIRALLLRKSSWNEFINVLKVLVDIGCLKYLDRGGDARDEA